MLKKIPYRLSRAPKHTVVVFIFCQFSKMIFIEKASQINKKSKVNQKLFGIDKTINQGNQNSSNSTKLDLK